MRQLGIQAFSQVLKQKKNCEIFEKYIYNKLEKSTLEKDSETFRENYLWCVYQVVGLILQEGTNLKKICDDVKKGLIGWEYPIYSQISSKIEEFDQYLAKPFEVVEGVIECTKCHSKKTWSIQRQTRSSDEPMTTYSRCVECGNQWAYSG